MTRVRFARAPDYHDDGTVAFPSEFSGSGRFRTIDLRYDKNDPAQPFKQSNYMPASTFVSLLASGSAVLPTGI